MINTKSLIQKALAKGFSPTERMAFHRNHQNENLTAYALKYRNELSSLYADYKKIYLDMKYWIYLREIANNEVDDLDKKAFFNIFNELFIEKKIISPLSIAHIAELEKIENEEKREKTIAIMNHYSDGLCILYYFDCITEELVAFFNNKNVLGPTCEWKVGYLDKIARILGTPKPIHDMLPEVENRSLQKYFYDLLSYIDFIDFMHFCKDDYQERQAKEELAQRHNINKKGNRYTGFQDALLTEVNGILSSADPFIEDAYHFCVNSTEILSKEQLQVLKNIILNFFKYHEKEAAKLLPTIYINSCLNAYFMIRPEEEYEGNDIDDIWHATISIPYCDFVFTEKKFSNIINYDRKIKIKDYFNTQIAYSLKKATMSLSSLK